jgi:CheY-like chemotaxis protein
MAKNVLIVDDSAPVRQLVLRGGARAGVAAGRAEATDVLDAASATAPPARFDLIVADLDLPGVGALDVTVQVAAGRRPAGGTR